MTHPLPKELIQSGVRIHIVGAGGNGSFMANGLARLNLSLRAMGHPGLDVAIWDDDVVSTANVGRQLFSPADVGQNKANVLIHRLNSFYATHWEAKPFRLGHAPGSRPSIIIGCVDSVASRRQIAGYAEGHGVSYWLDLGNEAKTGQFILGQPQDKKNKTQFRLPTVLDLFPQMGQGKGNPGPSCSLAGALMKQDLFINQAVATGALNLLWSFFRNGKLENHGGFVNLESFRMSPLPICTDTWARMGFGFNLPPLRKIKRVLRKPRPFLYGRFKLVCGHIMEGVGEKKIRCQECKRIVDNTPQKKESK